MPASEGEIRAVFAENRVKIRSNLQKNLGIALFFFSPGRNAGKKPDMQLIESPSPALSTRKAIEFQKPGIGIGLVIEPPRWDWLAIVKKIEAARALITIGSLSFGNREELLYGHYYGLMPWSKGELEGIIEMVDGWLRRRKRSVRDAVDVYRGELELMLDVARGRLAEYVCRPNPQGWRKQAWGYFLELQMNLAKVGRLYFLTYTFRAGTRFEEVSAAASAFAKDHLWELGFGSTGTIARHDERKEEGCYHVHLMIWSVDEKRNKGEERRAIRRLRAAINRGCCGIGLHKCTRIKGGRVGFLRVAAYLALNYHQALGLARGPGQSIPARARMLRTSAWVRAKGKWLKVGGFSFYTPAAAAFRRAIGKFAAATRKSKVGNWSWIWRERKRIARYLEPEKPMGATIAGGDGYTYQVTPYGRDCMDNETYLVYWGEERGLPVTVYGLEEMAKLMVMPGAFGMRQEFDPMTGRTGKWYEIWGLEPIYE